MTESASGSADPSEDDVAYRFDRTHQAAEVARGWADLAPGDESGVEVAVAGRVMLLRPQGKSGVRRIARHQWIDPALCPRGGDRGLRGLCPPQPWRLDRGPRPGGADPARRALGQGHRVGAAGQGPPKLRRQVARGSRRRERATASARWTCGPTSAVESSSCCAPTWSRACASACGRRALWKSRPQSCTPSPAVRRPVPSSPTTTRSIPTSICASPPSCT